MILLGLFIFLVIVGFFLRENVFFNLLEILVLVVTVGISTNIADFAAYNSVYQYIGAGNFYPNTGVGWWFLCKLGNMAGMTYGQFKMVILLLGLLLIRSTIKYFTSNQNYIWSLYIIYPAITDLIQIRFFMGIAIIIWAIKYLLRDTTKGYFIYCMLVIIAGQIHNSAYFYIFFIFWKIVIKNIRVTITMLTVFLGICFAEKSILVNIISQFGTGQENEFYLNNTLYQPTVSQTIFFSLMNAMFIVSAFYIRKSVILENQYDLIPKVEKNYLDFMLAVDIMAIVIISMAMFSFTFFRLQKPLWILNFIDVAIYMAYVKKGKVSPGIIITIYAILGIIALIGTENLALHDFFGIQI